MKTSDLDIESENDVIEKMPQDLEQLLIYVLLSKGYQETHYLVYYNEMSKNRFITFSVKIKNKGKIKHMAEERRNALDLAVKEKDPSHLKKCRYFDTGCTFREKNLCSCESKNSYEINVLKEDVIMQRDERFSEMLQKAYGNKGYMKRSNFSLWDIFSPRQAYLDRVSDTFNRFSDTDMMPQLFDEISLAIKKSKYFKETVTLVLNKTPVGKTMILSLPKTSDNDKRMINVDYASYVRIFKGKPANLENSGSLDYYSSRLGLICAISGDKNGILIVGFEQNPSLITTYVFKYKDLEGISHLASKAQESLTNALVRKDSSTLPLCIEFIRESCNGECLCKQVSESDS